MALPPGDLPARFTDLIHEEHVREAIDLARSAAERGDDPYGSVLVRADADEVVMTERNAVVTEDDVRRHPELTLAHRAAREFSPAQRADLIMYTSTEPCPMCAGGIAHVGLGAVVHATSAERGAELYGADSCLPSTEVYDRLGSDVIAAGPVLPEEGDAVHQESGGAVDRTE
ncbi:nucleoside deaminase [Halobaculum gomorrense]|uniref:tRNA(Arg) A34 adenosine deaminase TadA n=1 Tax=Halobaculum gomorrense TaxID=43928 RepID=A0A1M5P3G5_9EURY|nr:nucleoside deaminase [Halobaculum gomorrense]SHG95949.1 tRNA(Arg) A34 adenosine deaminase TadA [Halobaculum gomorrense]